MGDFYFIHGRLNHIYKDCPNLFADEYACFRGKKQYEPWLRADGVKSVSVEELQKGMRGKGRQMGSSNEAEGREEEAEGEEFALQVMQVEPKSFQVQDMEQVARGTNEAFGNDPRISGGFEPMIQEASMNSWESYELDDFKGNKLDKPILIYSGAFHSIHLE